jgi:colanic acid/amylovoran biosynthesis protein
MLIEIKGVQFVNKGAELMLHAILQKAQTIWPDAEFCLTPNNNSPYLSRAKVACYQKLNWRKNIFDLNNIFYFVPKKIRHYLKHSWGIVTEADIDIILDASGFSYGDQWPTLILKQTAIEAKRLKNKGKHYVFMPQALGPFSTINNKKAAQQAFKAASVVFAREENSFSHINACTQQANLLQAPDFTNLLMCKLPVKYEHLRGKVAIIPNSKMLSDKNNDSQWRTNYIQVLCTLIKVIKSKQQDIFLLNHEGKSDQKICTQINHYFNDELAIISPKSAISVKAIIGNTKFVVCSRYHGCVSALSQGVPCLGTSWSHKYEMLFDEYGVRQLLLQAELPAEKAHELVKYLLNDNNIIKQSLQSKALTFKQESEQMWQTLIESIKFKQ